MTSFLLVLCLLASSCFLLTQLVVYYYSVEDNGLRKVDNSFKLVQTFLKASKRLQIEPILIGIDQLTSFRDNELSHRNIGIHDHTTCRIFCGNASSVFLLKGKELESSKEELFKIFLKENIQVKILQGFDKREETIEIRHGKYELIYHIFLWQHDAFLHLLIVYPRLNHEWGNDCAFNNQPPLISRHVKSSIYCKRQNIFKPIDYTSVLIDGIQVNVPVNVNLFLSDMSEATFLPCNFFQARQFVSTYGADTTDESQEFRVKAKHILSIVSRVLSNLNVRFWLSSGTCLGWYRQCDFIPHSKDVDIGIWIKDYKGELIADFASSGLTLKHMFGKLEDSYELSFQISDVKLDIFFFYVEDNHMWNGGTQVKTGKKFKYVFKKFDICWTSISDLLVRVPCDTGTYIEANYGSNWNVQVKTWDWKASPPNVQENGEWPEHERKKVIQTF